MVWNRQQNEVGANQSAARALNRQLVIRLLQWPELGTTSLWLIKRSLSWI